VTLCGEGGSTEILNIPHIPNSKEVWKSS